LRAGAVIAHALAVRLFVLSIVIVVVSCVPRRVHREETAIEPTEETPPRADAPVDSDVDCSALARAECLGSQACVLVLLRPDDEIGYACRPPENDCERGLRQDTLAENGGAECAARDGCSYRAGQCYCECHDAGRTAVPDLASAPHCDCECAGGPPPSCEPS
jgi:hypothetical protein